MLARKKSFLFILGTIFFILLTAACSSDSKSDDKKEKQETADQATEKDSGQAAFEQDSPIVTITMEGGDQIQIELYPHIAPNTVDNFINLAEDGFYDGLIFHRVIPGFMIQGGDPDGNGTGGPGYAIKGEFSSNGYENDLKHHRGVISMARSADPDSAGSQFFIMAEDSSHLDEDYAAFGQVTDGMDVIDDIVSQETDKNDKPLEDQRMEKVEVDTKGHKFSEPEIME